VIGESEPLQALSLPEVPELSESRYVCDPADPTEKLDEYSQLYPALRGIKKCQEKDKQDTSEINLTLAQFKLAVERERALGQRVKKHLPTEIDQVVNTIDVRAFGHSQSGVPDADQIEKAAKSGCSFPSLTQGYTAHITPPPISHRYGTTEGHAI
jgi:hypothetical protein